MHFVVATDTSGNLPTRTAEAHDLKIIPFAYFIDGSRHTCVDTDTFDGDAFYALLKNTAVTTTQINPVEYADFFEPFLQEGKDVIYVSMSSGISGSCQSATIGAEMLKERYPDRTIEIVDTRGASLGEGLIAVHAAKLRDEGVSTQEAAKRLRVLSERMFNVFTVNDLMFLRRGGRLSNLSAIAGTVLGIKPILNKLKKSEIEPNLKLIRESPKAPKDILLVDYEPVTGSHVGPGALALFFESYEGIRAIKGLDWSPVEKHEPGTTRLRPIGVTHGV